MDYEDDAAVLAYVKHVLEELRISPTALAHKSGISPTTLTRPLNNDKYKFKLSTSTLSKIAVASGISYASFVGKKDFTSMSLAAVHDKGQYDEELWGKSPDGDLRSTVVIGKAARGTWQEVSVHNPSFQGMLLINSANYSAKDCFALEVADLHVGKYAEYGDYLMCVRYEACKDDIGPDRLVILEQRQENRRLVEFTVRRLNRIKSGWTLTTVGGRDPIRHQITLRDLPGTDEAQIAGMVLYVVREVWP